MANAAVDAAGAAAAVAAVNAAQRIAFALKTYALAKDVLSLYEKMPTDEVYEFFLKACAITVDAFILAVSTPDESSTSLNEIENISLNNSLYVNHRRLLIFALKKIKRKDKINEVLFAPIIKQLECAIENQNMRTIHVPDVFPDTVPVIDVKNVSFAEIFSAPEFNVYTETCRLLPDEWQISFWLIIPFTMNWLFRVLKASGGVQQRERERVSADGKKETYYVRSGGFYRSKEMKPKKNSPLITNEIYGFVPPTKESRFFEITKRSDTYNRLWSNLKYLPFFFKDIFNPLEEEGQIFKGIRYQIYITGMFEEPNGRKLCEVEHNRIKKIIYDPPGNGNGPIAHRKWGIDVPMMMFIETRE